MPHLFERTALILLASTALTAFVTPSYAFEPPAAVVAPSADAAGVDVAARTRSRGGAAATYTVKRGDTLAEIAQRLGTDVETIAKANDLKRPYRLQPGQVLKNPKAPAPAAPSRASTSTRSSGETYTVRSGDTLFGIAQRLGTTVDALRSANGLGRNSGLRAGQKLRLPGSAAGETRAEAADEDAALADRMANAASRRNAPSQPEAAEPAARAGERTVTSRDVTGGVVNVDVPGKAYKVQKGDSLERVARRLDSDVAELARINKLKKPYRLQPGQTLRGPGGSAKAYVVGRGDTLGEIARRFSVTEAELRSANGLRRGASVAPGRRLRLPAGYRDRGPLTTTTRAPEPVAQPPVTVTPRETPPAETPPPRPQVQPPVTRPPTTELPDRPQPYRAPPGGVPGAPVATPQASDAQIMEMGRGRFEWPLRGELISGFGGRGTGPRNDGLNIRATAGDPVRSAAAGDVVYAGDQVPGFGNLVLVKHADGWVTAYGHLGRVDVKMQQKVTQGQQIGQAGSSGGVSETQLHFEVRYAPSPQERARPVDPTLVLPR